MITFRDLAPVIVAGIAAVFVLLLTWHAWHQAHKSEGRKRRNDPQPGE
ncbi:MAG TPA: hypothetical protein VGB04_14005 [Allosphingosinicella sp.]|jgi:hypothetical protein